MEILNFQDKKYVIRLKTPDTGFSVDKLDWYKWYRQADTVLKKNGLLYFVDTISEINFEEIQENS